MKTRDFTLEQLRDADTPRAHTPRCRACALHLATRGVPCLDHTTDGMRDVRALAMGLVR